MFQSLKVSGNSCKNKISGIQVDQPHSPAFFASSASLLSLYGLEPP
jgi:hypothetical protein